MPPRPTRPAEDALARTFNLLRHNLGAVFGLVVLLMLFGPKLKSTASVASNYKSFSPRTLPPPQPREPSPFRVPLCAAPSWPGKALVEDLSHCPPPEWGALYSNYQADELIKVRDR